jgi:putative membrane protein
MLLHDAGLSYLHFVFAFIMVGAIVAEAFILRLPVDGRVARLLLRVDLFYGVSALLLILAGIARVVWGAKGWTYYQAEPFFWAKMATFAVIGLVSIAPTRTFIRWVKAAGADAAFAVPEAEVRRVRRLVVLETHLVALLLVFAVLMARGVGHS